MSRRARVSASRSRAATSCCPRPATGTFYDSLTLFCQRLPMKKAAILALAALVAFPAFAAEEKKEGGHESAEGKKGGKAGTNVDMPFLMAPLTNEDGKLTGYAYISTRLTAMSE